MDFRIFYLMSCPACRDNDAVVVEIVNAKDLIFSGRNLRFTYELTELLVEGVVICFAFKLSLASNRA